MVRVVTPSKRATPCWRCTTKLPDSRSSKNPSAARARGRARRCGIRRPVTSVSERTATLASGRMKPLVTGAATTTAPGLPVAVSSTGACTPCSARAADNRAVPAPVAAHSVTEYPSPTSRVTPAARRAGSPATGSKRRTVSALVDGPSGTLGSATTPASQSRSRRSKFTWRRGKAPSSASLAPHVAASVSANAASSSSSWVPRSRIRRGSARTTWLPAPSRSGSTRSVCSRNGSHDSMPSNCSPRSRRSHTDDPQGRRVTSDAAAAWISEVTTSSRQPKRATAATSCSERWSLTANTVSRSTSSPHRSMRTGTSAVEGNTSTIPPRTANSPRCSTWCSRR